MADHDEEQPHEHHRLEDERSEMDASWGGVNLSVRGSIVVLAILIVVDAAATLWFLGLQNTHFDAILQEHAHRMELQDTEVQKAASAVAEVKTITLLQTETITREIDRNRFYLREIQRVCMLTPVQREKLQQSLTPSMRELLFKGEGVDTH